MKDLLTLSKRLLLIVGDITIYAGSLYLVLVYRYGDALTNEIKETHFQAFGLAFPIWLTTFYLLDLYEVSVIRDRLRLVAFSFRGVLIGGILTSLIFYFMPGLAIAPKINLLIFIVVFSCLFIVFRTIIVWYFDRLTATREKILILCANEEECEIANSIKNSPRVRPAQIDIERIEGFEMDKICRAQFTTLVLDTKMIDNQEVSSSLYRLLPEVRIKELVDYSEEAILKIPLGVLTSSWFLRNLREDEKKLHEYAKRVLDLVIGLVAFALMLAILPVVYLAIQLEDAGPIFYRQKRVGRFGKPFDVIKFRSMKVDSEGGKAMWAKKNDDRTTRVGRILRKTSIDEVPQCINILLGSMSAVGPRPERTDFMPVLDQEVPFYQMRHLVKPGLSGWAQINYPYGASVEDAKRKLEYDFYYVKNRSFFLDLRIILKTVGLYFKNERGKLAR